MNHTIARRMRLSVAFSPQAAAAKPDAGDTVAEVRWFPVREPVSGNRYTLLRVKTRSGLTGWGECATGSADELKALEATWRGRPAHSYAAIDASTPAGGALDSSGQVGSLGKASLSLGFGALGRAFGVYAAGWIFVGTGIALATLLALATRTAPATPAAAEENVRPATQPPPDDLACRQAVQLLSDYLEEGLSQFGFSCAEFEIGRL